MRSLIERGFVQGAVVNCENIISQPEFKSAIESGRAIPEKRDMKVTTNHSLIVLSQDCDISNSHEKYIEVATAKQIKSNKNNPVLEKTRSTRKLHLEINQTRWEIESSLISTIPKNVVEQDNSIIPQFNITGDAKDILIQWRINRYAREPFPDPFNQALISDYLHKTDTELDDLFRNNSDKIIDIFAFVEPLDDEHASEYLVSLTLVLSSDCDSNDVKCLKAKFKPHIEQLNENDNKLSMLQVEGKAEQPESLTNSALVCLPSDFTFEDANCMRRLTLDFLCWD